MECPICKETMVKHRMETEDGEWMFGWLCGCNEELRKRDAESPVLCSAGLNDAPLKEKKKPIGMYGETPRVRIGKFTICRQDPEGEDRSLWIERVDGGEGAEFSDDLLGKVIEEYYEKNF